MPKIIITTQSIKNRLKNYHDKPEDSILEYIWNGFDADADNIRIKYHFQTKVDGVAFGYPNLEIYDDGYGWDIENIKETDFFLVSPKKSVPNKSLPQGKDGVGRFTFYSFAKKATWETVYKEKKYRLSLESETLDDYDLKKGSSSVSIEKGTKITFDVVSDKLTEDFLRNELIEAIKLEFCWFLKLYPNKNIYINNEKIDINNLISKEKKIDDFEIDNNNFNLQLVQWKLKPTREFSKYYFTNEKNIESFTKTTGLNYQSDDFFHSVYIKSNFFNGIKSANDLAEEDANTLPFASKKENKNKEIYKKLLEEIRKQLEMMRKPFLEKLSKAKVKEWKEKNILPKVEEFGLIQEEYEKIIKEVYVAVPQLFKNCNDDHKKIILRFFSSLLSLEEKDCILKILEQVYCLTQEERKSLAELLERTTLSNIIKTIKEVDSRLLILDTLENILFDNDKNKFTREVDHLQKILDENFWIFGEDYRLLASAEGSIKKSLMTFKNKILRKEDEKINTKSRKELDLFIAKVDETSKKINCIVVEIKRPSVVLGKKEYDQIYDYMNTIVKEPSCNGDKINWKFYLVGLDYSDYIEQQIDNVKTWGEKDEGLAFVIDNKKAKLYIKKWSDIINVEQKSRYKYLQEKLNIELKKIKSDKVDDIVNSVKK